MENHNNEQFKKKALEKLSMIESEASDETKHPKLSIFAGLIRTILKGVRKAIDEDPDEVYKFLETANMHIDEVLASYENTTEQENILDRKDTERQNNTDKKDP